MTDPKQTPNDDRPSCPAPIAPDSPEAESDGRYAYQRMATPWAIERRLVEVTERGIPDSSLTDTRRAISAAIAQRWTEAHEHLWAVETAQDARDYPTST